MACDPQSLVNGTECLMCLSGLQMKAIMVKVFCIQTSGFGDEIVNCDPQSLTNGTECLLCMSPSMLKAMKLRLMCAILSNEQLDCDPQALANSSQCIADCMSDQQMEAAEILLWCTLYSAPGG